jgi:hypothetical protein
MIDSRAANDFSSIQANDILLRHADVKLAPKDLHE